MTVIAHNTLFFEKISSFDRTEPVSFGVPFAEGECPDAGAFRLVDGGKTVPCQTKVTGSWPDGSVKWLFVRALVDLPGNASKTVSFELDSAKPAPAPAVPVSVGENPDGSLSVETGRLGLTVPAKGLWPVRDVRLDGRTIWDADPFRGVRAKFGGIDFEGRECGVELTVEEAGPICAVVRIDAKLPEGDTSLPGLRARLVFWAGRPDFVLRHRLTNRSTDLGTATPVTAWSLETAPAGEEPLLRVNQACYRDNVRRSAEALDLRFSAEWWRTNTSEHQFDCFAHNSWADWQCGSGGLMLSLRHASQNFPSGYVAAPGRLAVEMSPREGEAALDWLAGVAKTHEVLFHVHGPDADDVEFGTAAAQFQMPDRPRLETERYGRSGVWPERVFEGPVIRKVMAFFTTVADMRPGALGVFNFGDEPDPGYTNQGRGRADADETERLVWLNNEYDLAHHLFLFHARTGERRFLDYGLTSARHWMDVDIVHSDVERKLRGGHIAHCRLHAAVPGVYPSHQWVQGLFDAWHLSGDPDALELAVGVADCVAWQTENLGFLEPGNAATREMGWALRAMLNAWLETGERKYFDVGCKIEALFADWGDGGGELLAPYTVHSEPRAIFMNALTGVSLARWSIATGRELGGKVAVAVADDLIANGMTAWGQPYYKELPSLKRIAAGTVAIELGAYAFALTGERKYLQAFLPALEAALTTSGYHLGAYRKVPIRHGIRRLCEAEPKGGKSFAMSLPAVLQFIALSGSEKLAKSLDYSLEL